MATSSILGGDAAARQADGKDVDRLGPSDSSDSGSDVQGASPMPTAPDNPGEWGAVVSDPDSDSDAGGTGERASADGTDAVDGADILPDRIVDDPGLAGDPADRRRSVEAGELADEEGTEDDPDDEGSTSDDRDSGDVERDAPASRR
jgi:hypothetical protein